MKTQSPIKSALGIFLVYLLAVCGFLYGFCLHPSEPVSHTSDRRVFNRADKPTFHTTIPEIDVQNCSAQNLLYNSMENTLHSIRQKGTRYSLRTWEEKDGWSTTVASWKIKKNETLDNFSYNKTGELFACRKKFSTPRKGYHRKKLKKQDVVRLGRHGKIKSLSLIGLNRTWTKKKSASVPEITDLQVCDTTLAVTYQYGSVKIYNIAERQALGASSIKGSACHNVFYDLHFLSITKNSSTQELLLNNYDIRFGDVSYSFPLGGNGQSPSDFLLSNYQNELCLLTPEGVYIGACDETTLTRKKNYSHLQLPSGHRVTYWQASRDQSVYLGYETPDKTFHLRHVQIG